MMSVPDIVNAISLKADVQKALLTLKDQHTLIGTEKKNRDEVLQELMKSKEEAVDAIKNFRMELEHLLEEMEKESIKEVENEFYRMESSLKRNIKMAEEEKDALQKTTNNLQKAKGNKAQEFVCMKIAQKKTQSTDAIVRSLQTETEAKVVFSPNQEIINFLQLKKLFGSVKSCRQAILSSKKILYKVKGTREINIKTPNDTNICCAIGSCFTQDGMILLADYNNKTLKRVDLAQMVVVDQCKLSNSPCDICCVSKQEAAVSLANNTVQFVTLGKKIKTTRHIKLEHICYGIAYHDDRLYITDLGKSLYIHDMTGNVLQRVTKDNSGHDLFNNSRLIAFSDNGDKLFVTDRVNGVVVLDALGTYIDTFRDENLKSTFGVCLDNCGNILLSGFESQNVVQMSQDGKESYGEVVESSYRIDQPYSVNMNPCGCELIVTQADNDNIVLFDLL